MRFLTRNYLVDPTSITVVSGDPTKARMCDKDIQSYWVSVGSNDTITETITIVLSGDQTINSFSFMGINFKEYTVQYSATSGGALSDFSTPIAETANTAAYTFHSFNSVVVRKIVITATKTIVPNAQKVIYEAIAYYAYTEIPDEWLPSERTESEFPSAVHDLVSGGKVKVYLGTLEKYHSNISFKNLSPVYSNILKLIFQGRREFFFMPYSSDPSQQYAVVWINNWNFMPVLAWDSSGDQCLSGSIEIGEI